MIVDSSAMVAIIKREPDWLALYEKIYSTKTLRMSVASYLETSIVLDSRRDEAMSAKLDDMIEEVQIILDPVTVEQAKMARQAYRAFGKGSGHPAGLNFGDCFTYALAREKREPVLWKGDDFGHTDLRPAIE
jgi:ribonuclease VapC